MLQSFRAAFGQAGRAALQYIFPFRTQPQIELQDLQSAINALRNNRVLRPSIDHMCWRYIHCRQTFRRVDEAGRIRRISRTRIPSRSPPRLRSPLGIPPEPRGGAAAGQGDRKVPSILMSKGSATPQAHSGDQHGVSTKATREAPVLAESLVGEHGASAVRVETKTGAPDQQTLPPPVPNTAPAQPPPPETLKQKTERVRGEMMEQYGRERDEWQAWRDNYRTLLEQHQLGINPGLGPRWSAAWTREEFDIQHLARARRMTQKVVKTEARLNDIIAIAKKLRIEPLDWQINQFPAGPHYYTESQENGLIATAPKAEIYTWRKQLPDDSRDFGRPRLDIEPIPVGDAGYHRVDYPDDMDVGPDGDVEPWDSTSEIALKYTRPLIDQNQPAGPPGWTKTREQKKGQDDTKMFLSHWF